MVRIFYDNEGSMRSNYNEDTKNTSPFGSDLQKSKDKEKIDKENKKKSRLKSIKKNKAIPAEELQSLEEIYLYVISFGENIMFKDISLFNKKKIKITDKPEMKARSYAIHNPNLFIHTERAMRNAQINNAIRKVLKGVKK